MFVFRHWSDWPWHGLTRPDSDPAPKSPHRRVWRGFRRYCVCGLRWPCLDRGAPPQGARLYGVAPVPRPAWVAEPTANQSPPLTFGQQVGYRVPRNGGRHVG